MPVTKGFRQLVAEAEKRIQTRSVAEALSIIDDPTMVFVDLRDPRELEREGMVPGAFHATRGMLEFWVDPESPYYKPVFTDDKTFILYCQADWRGTLAAATLGDMGMANVLHLQGGFGDWRKAGAPTAAKPEKKKA